MDPQLPSKGFSVQGHDSANTFTVATEAPQTVPTVLTNLTVDYDQMQNRGFRQYPSLPQQYSRPYCSPALSHASSRALSHMTSGPAATWGVEGPVAPVQVMPHVSLYTSQQPMMGDHHGSASGTSRPVYGPSVTPLHPQFVDFATNTTRMTPFHVAEEQEVRMKQLYSLTHSATAVANPTMSCRVPIAVEQGQRLVASRLTHDAFSKQMREATEYLRKLEEEENQRRLEEMEYDWESDGSTADARNESPRVTSGHHGKDLPDGIAGTSCYVGVPAPRQESPTALVTGHGKTVVVGRGQLSHTEVEQEVKRAQCTATIRSTVRQTEHRGLAAGTSTSSQAPRPSHADVRSSGQPRDDLSRQAVTSARAPHVTASKAGVAPQTVKKGSMPTKAAGPMSNAAKVSGKVPAPRATVTRNRSPPCNPENDRVPPSPTIDLYELQQRLMACKPPERPPSVEGGDCSQVRPSEEPRQSPSLSCDKSMTPFDEKTPKRSTANWQNGLTGTANTKSSVASGSCTRSSGKQQQQGRGGNTSGQSGGRGSLLATDGSVLVIDVVGHHQQSKRIVAPVSLAVSVGMHIVYEGDRGVDLGVVRSRSTIIPSKTTVVPSSAERPKNGGCGASDGNSIGNDGGKADDDAGTVLTTHDVARMPQALRLASESEVHDWSHTLVSDANAAALDCASIAQNLLLPLKIHGGSFQLDRQKLTVFYESEGRVDFRPLLQEMFGKYRCRIWMERV